MASLAQQESQSLSQNVKLGLQFRYQNGQVQVNHNHFLGYTKDDEGNLIIDPEQAEVVKRIYRKYLEGYSMNKIAKDLKLMVFSPAPVKQNGGRAPLTKSFVMKNTSAMRFFKRPTPPTSSNKTRVKNNGIVPQYYVEGNHEAIIPKGYLLAECRKNWYAGE
ncbi:MAG: recombinase family protein [Dorea longicatena]